jgi:hypothetical protein
VSGVRLADGFARSTSEVVSPWKRGLRLSGLTFAKLHGSVTWYRDEHPSSPVYLRLDRGYPLPEPDFHLSRGGADATAADEHPDAREGDAKSAQ